VTPRDRRALIVGAALLLGGSLLLRGAPMLRAEWRGERDRLAAERRLLNETRRALEGLPAMEDSTKVLTARIAALAPRILSGTSAPLALSDLSGRLSTLIGLYHGRMVRFEAAPDTGAAGPLRRVSAIVALESDFRGLAELLDRLQRDQLVTVVTRVQLAPADPLAPSSTPERIDVELSLNAWYLARESDS
jgi:hypothetical protein